MTVGGVGRSFIASTADDAITSPATAGSPVVCMAEGGAHGCGLASGLHHPHDLALTPDGTQLYAATDDGVASFNIPVTADPPTFAGCVDSGSTDGCASAPAANAGSIAISPDGTSVYVGSPDGSVVALRRAPNGALSGIGCFSKLSPAPAGCVTGHGLQHVTDVAASPDGKSVYVIGADSHAIATFARAADGTLTQQGCIATTAADTCTARGDLSTIDSVAVSPDGESVYVGNTQGDVAAFRRAPSGPLIANGCIGASGGPCSHAALTSYSGAVAVTPTARGSTSSAATRTSIRASSARRRRPTCA